MGGKPPITGSIVEFIMSVIELVCHYIDRINGGVGKTLSYLFIPLTSIVMFEVLMRYIFERPQIWTWDISIMLYGTMIIVGGSYVLLQEKHIRVDVLLMRLSPKTRKTLDLITSPIFFLGCGLLLWEGSKFAWESLQISEGMGTIWNPPIYPLKIMIPLGALLLLFQGLAKFLRDLKYLITCKEKKQ